MTKKKYTRQNYEEYLNEIGCSLDSCIYLTNPKRGKSLSINSLRLSLAKQKYGKILRTFDPIAFNVGFNDWIRK